MGEYVNVFCDGDLHKVYHVKTTVICRNRKNDQRASEADGVVDFAKHGFKPTQNFRGNLAQYHAHGIIPFCK